MNWDLIRPALYGAWQALVAGGLHIKGRRKSLDLVGPGAAKTVIFLGKVAAYFGAPVTCLRYVQPGRWLL